MKAAPHLSLVKGPDMHPGTARSFVPMLAVKAVVMVTLFLFLVASARADSTPVGVLPEGTESTVRTQRGFLLAVALPRPKPSTGLVWRLARGLDPTIVRQTEEVETGASIIVVFKVVGYGTTSIVFALTRGEASPKALSSHTTRIVSRGDR
jgi:hypothetical protein